MLFGQGPHQIFFAQTGVAHILDRSLQFPEPLIGLGANALGQLASKPSEVLDQYLATVEIDLHSSGLKEWAKRCAKAQSIEPTDKARDMLTKSIHEYFRKTATAECFFFHCS
jgi:hypothetical protein